jgi:hypothetical protein
MAIYTTRTGHTFNTDNIAYQRFQRVIGEHFLAIVWAGDDDFPHAICLLDAESGQGFSVRLIESTEEHEPVPQAEVAGVS